MQTKSLARWLGYAGLIPFIAFSLLAWVDITMPFNPHYLLQSYAAVILAFMGAVHWGVAMTGEDRFSQTQLGLSIVPPLVAWLALMIPQVYGYSLLIVSFAALCMVDGMVSRHQRFPPWYSPMRVVLTTIVVLCLILAATAGVLRQS